VLNRADQAGQDNEDAITYFSEYPNLKYLDAPIGNRKAFAHAASKGRAVVEYTPRDHKATEEISKLFGVVKEIGMVSK
jgi:chromosome partitioning protein